MKQIEQNNNNSKRIRNSKIIKVGSSINGSIRAIYPSKSWISTQDDNRPIVAQEIVIM